ncbi:MAG: glutamate--tRNA ligase [Verrucomicrobiales bacterium]|nr:glutamate--tRNA ligase [Verrucomicrobiales bacterium]
MTTNTSPAPIRVRFAPSPTGYLHVGGARTALFNWLFAKRHGGVFVLRIEDTDAARNTPQALAAILDGLRWLGLDWDEGPEAGGDFGPYFQSQRGSIYDRHLQSLQDRGFLYEDNGSIRFRSPRQEIVFEDKVCGQVRIDRSNEPDMTLRRPDGSYIFHFVNVVDDMEMGISHVIRGEDHLMNTPKHLELFQAFGVTPPVYAHIPLFLNQDGSKMSKRDQGAAVDSYMEAGFVPEAVRNYLCLLGWSPKDDREMLPIEDVISLFDWDHLNRAPSRFDFTKCQWLNSRYLAEMSEPDFLTLARGWLERACPHLLALAGLQLDAALRLMKPKVKHIPETAEHLTMLFCDDAPIEEAGRDKLRTQKNGQANAQALTQHLSSAGDWHAEAIQVAIQAAASDLGAKTGALMFPLRFCVTGSSHGVDLMPALVLLGRETVLRRLKERIPKIFS